MLRNTRPSRPRSLSAAFAILALLSTPACAGFFDPEIPHGPGAARDARGQPLLTAGDAAPEAVWDAFGGVSLGPPAAVVSPVGDIDVFIHGDDNALWTRRYDRATGAWRDWQSLGGVLMSAPAAVAAPDGRVDVFVRGTDNALWTRSRLPALPPGSRASGWAEWQSLGGLLTSAPAAASGGSGRLDVVVRGTDMAIWHRGLRGGVWAEWTSLGGVATSSPAAASWGGERLDVFVRGTDNALWHRYRDGSGPSTEAGPPTWSADWQSRGGVLWSSPAAASVTFGRIDVAVRGTDNALWVLRHDRAWGGWQSGGGKLFSTPSILVTGGDAPLFLGTSGDSVLCTLHAPGAPEGGRRIEGARLLPGPE